MSNFLILHIGSIKTGTSAIQAFLYKNDTLLREQGFSYPCIQDSDYRFINACALEHYRKWGKPDTQNPGWMNFWDKVRKHLKETNVILSWEVMFHCETASFFSAVQKEYDNIKVIVYLRRQDRYIESYWNQSVKYIPSITTPFPIFALLYDKYTDYLKRLDILASLFGRENIIVRVYEKGQFQGERKDVISDFLYALGIKLDWQRCVVPVNQNPAMFGNFAEIKCTMNFYDDNSNKFRAINEVFNRFIALKASVTSLKPADGMLAPEQRTAFLKRFESENREIAQKYLGRADGILFYENNPVPMHKFDCSTLCTDVNEGFQYIFSNLQQWCDHHPDTGSMPICETRELFDSKLSMLQKKTLQDDEIKAAVLNLVEECMAKLTDAEYGGKKNTIHAIQQHISGKRLYFMGAGEYCWHFIWETSLMPDAFLDNSVQHSGKVFCERPLLNPSQIKDWSNCFIIITVKKPDVIAAVEQQLQGYGLKKDKDYLIGSEYFIDSF